MTRKFVIAAAFALAALATIGGGTAQAHRGGHGHPGWAYTRGWGPRYYTYHVVPYYTGPRCVLTVYGWAYCY